MLKYPVLSIASDPWGIFNQSTLPGKGNKSVDLPTLGRPIMAMTCELMSALFVTEMPAVL